MALLGDINFNEVHTNDELIPAGEYQAIIVASGAKPEDPQTAEGFVISRTGKGAYLPMTFEICEGEFKGRQIRKNFNLMNNNPDAVRIARGEMKQLLMALNWDFVNRPTGPKETNEIHMIPLVIKITQEENKQTGDLQNNIKKFIAPGGVATAAPQAVAAPIGTAPMVKPWQRKAENKPAAVVTQPTEVPKPAEEQPKTEAQQNDGKPEA